MKQTILTIIMIVASCIAMQAQSPFYAKGYSKDLSLAAGNYKGEPSLGVQTAQGYSFGNGLFLGASVGADLFLVGTERSGFCVPVAATLRYHFLDAKVSPFASCSIGTAYDSGMGELAQAMAKTALGVSVSRWSFYVEIRQLDWQMQLNGTDASYQTNSLQLGISLSL